MALADELFDDEIAGDEFAGDELVDVLRLAAGDGPAEGNLLMAFAFPCTTVISVDVGRLGFALLVESTVEAVSFNLGRF